MLVAGHNPGGVSRVSQIKIKGVLDMINNKYLKGFEITFSISKEETLKRLNKSLLETKELIKKELKYSKDLRKKNYLKSTLEHYKKLKIWIKLTEER